MGTSDLKVTLVRKTDAWSQRALTRVLFFYFKQEKTVGRNPAVFSFNIHKMVLFGKAFKILLHILVAGFLSRIHDDTVFKCHGFACF